VQQDFPAGGLVSTITFWRRAGAVALPVALISAAAVPSAGSSDAPVHAARTQTTKLISHAYKGGVPNGPSTNGVISGDKRYARIIAYQSTASNIVRGDTNKLSDVFAIRRAGHFGNKGTRWKPGKTRLISRALHGRANGPSYAPAVDGGFKAKPKCVAFLSLASNLVGGDNNRVADAFVSKKFSRPRLVSKTGRSKHTKAPTTRVAVSGDCSKIAFVAGGQLYVRIHGSRSKRLNVPGPENDPSFSTGKRNDLVFSGKRGVYLWRGKGRPRLIARGGRNPAYNDIKRHVVAYEISRHGRTQIGYKDLGKRQHIISKRGGSSGNGNSVNPVIGNSGYYVTFQSTASNLGTNPARQTKDHNGKPDVYLYSNVRNLDLLMSTKKGNGEPTPGGGTGGSMSFYANYVLFSAPHVLARGTGSPQIFMRWLGSV
jgi:hypothetical protein